MLTRTHIAWAHLKFIGPVVSLAFQENLDAFSHGKGYSWILKMKPTTRSLLSGHVQELVSHLLARHFCLHHLERFPQNQVGAARSAPSNPRRTCASPLRAFEATAKQKKTNSCNCCLRCFPSTCTSSPKSQVGLEEGTIWFCQKIQYTKDHMEFGIVFDVQITFAGLPIIFRQHPYFPRPHNQPGLFL